MNIQQLYLEYYDTFKLSYNDRLHIEFSFGLNDSPVHNYEHTLKDFVNMYDECTFNNYFGYIKEIYNIDTYNILHNKSNSNIPLNQYEFELDAHKFGYCPKCSGDVNSSMNFCKYCGNELNWETNS